MVCPKFGKTYVWFALRKITGLKHIAEHGFKVKYIWISDFKRFSLDLEEAEKTGGPKPNLFDYMNVKKHYPPGEINQPLQEILDGV